MVANFQAEQLLFAGRQARAAAANAMSNARMNALFSLAQGAFSYAMLQTPGAPPGGVGATAALHQLAGQILLADLEQAPLDRFSLAVKLEHSKAIAM